MNPLFKKIQTILRGHKRFIINDPRLKRSAVLLLLYMKNNAPHGIFTKRTTNLKRHKGEISLPGGGIEEGDKSLLDTAFRETEEEIDLGRSKINILGELDDLFTISGYIITPFVGYFEYPYEFKINFNEVEELIEVPISVFQSTDNFSEENWGYEGDQYPVYYYEYNSGKKTYIIWGATGYIMNGFIDLVFNFNPSKTKYKRRNPNLMFKK
ncbi:MAG: CoA pyrophosphatase [Candidatus Helarchaeota archaeon]|nr:CoA pyrophosphatase [Candidatus Helarchaeota archaeon]